MPQTVVVTPRSSLAQLKQAAAADSAIQAYNNSWAYADEGLLPGKKHYQHDYTGCTLENDDYAERLQELVGGQRAIAAAATALRTYSAAMVHSVESHAEHKAASAEPVSDLDKADFACRLAEVVQHTRGALSAATHTMAQYNATMAFADPGRSEHKAGATAAPSPLALDLVDLQERLAELLAAQRIPAQRTPDAWQYAANGGCSEHTPGVHQEGMDLPEMAARLAELCKSACAFAAVPNAWQYAAEGGRPEPNAGGDSRVEAPLELSDMAERLSELLVAA